MDKLIYLVPALLCPVIMGGLMWFMMRGVRKPMADADVPRDRQPLQPESDLTHSGAVES